MARQPPLERHNAIPSSPRSDGSDGSEEPAGASIRTNFRRTAYLVTLEHQENVRNGRHNLEFSPIKRD
jgi:hypothetical protein